MSAQSDVSNDVSGFNPPAEAVGDSAAPGDSYTLSGDFRGATVNIKSILKTHALGEINRHYMLRRLQKDWLEGVLEPVKAIHSLIDLEVQYRPQAVESPWEDVIQREENPNSRSSATDQILNVFDSANGCLLILGEPGAGKTITLLQLANELVLRAEKEADHPIPIVLNLSAWDEHYISFRNWLVEELRGKYFVPPPIAEGYVTDNALTLLLDGLDEVSEDKRSACIEAINVYRRDHGPTQIVVCSRKAEYENQPQRLRLDEAVLLQPLTQRQITQFLATDHLGQDVARTLNQDATLRQLAQTPLMLNIMLMAGQEISAQDWSNLGDGAAHLRRLFDVYLEHVFNRRGPSQSHIRNSTLRVLPWLAHRMSEQGQTVFLMEGLSPAWLKTKWQRLIFTSGMHILMASLLTLAISLVYVLADAPPQYIPRIAVAVGIAALLTNIASARLNNSSTLLVNMLLTTLTCSWALGSLQAGVIAGFILGIPSGATAIAIKNPRISDKLPWSWRRTLWVLAAVIIFEFFAGIFISQTSGIKALSTIADWLHLTVVPIGVGATLLFGWRPILLSSTVKPNQGFWQSMRNAIGITLFLMLVLIPLSIPSGLLRNLGNQQPIWEPSGLLPPLLFVISIVWLVTLPISLVVGGAACLQQLIVRSILTRTEKLPWNLVQILDHATDRILLQRVGGGYIFQHRLLQDYFANPKPEPIKEEQQ